MEPLIIFAVMWLIGRLIRGNKKRKTAGSAQQQGSEPQSRQQQAIEEQRRRRAAYEAARQQQAKKDYDRQTQRLFGTAEDEDRTETHEPHHIDEEEEQRCAEAAEKKARERKVSQQELKRELLQRFGSLEERQSLKPRPQTLEQAQQQLNMPVDAPPQPVAAPRPRIAQAGSFTSQVISSNHSFLTLHSDALVQGIIMAEILGPPRAKKRSTGNFFGKNNQDH